MKRAISDGARGLFLVRTNYKAPYWLALKRVSKLQQEIEADASLYTNSSVQLGRHTLFAADFSALSQQIGLTLSPRRRAGRRLIVGAMDVSRTGRR